MTKRSDKYVDPVLVRILANVASYRGLLTIAPVAIRTYVAVAAFMPLLAPSRDRPAPHCIILRMAVYGACGARILDRARMLACSRQLLIW